MPPEHVVQRTDEAQAFVTRRIGGETLIVPVAGHVLNLESIFVVNDVAARIWEMLAAPIDVERIAAALADEFAVTVDRARADAEAFVADLAARGLVRASTAAAR